MTFMKLFSRIIFLLIIFTGFYSIAQENVVKEDSVKVVSIDSTKIALTKNNFGKIESANSELYYTTVNQRLAKPLKVQVVYNGNEPLANFPVYFETISTPIGSVGSSLFQKLVHTDENGYAQTEVKLGSIEGEYEYSARIKTRSNHNDIVFFKTFARKSNWVFFLVSGLIGGLGLFLFGMDLMSEGMKKVAGAKLRLVLETLTNNRLVAVAVGIFITMVMQSSSATTVMLVSFVQAQLMTFSQTLGIILGAGIGTTITAQMIAFKFTDYSLIIIGIGFGIVFLSKSKKIKNIGEFILGFGILFFGMYIMSNSMYPLRTYQPFIDLLMHLENPIVGIVIGTIFTALIQSSGAFIGIIIVLGTQGLITLEAAIPLILGTNIGTSITAILASLNSSRAAKRVALAHTFSKILGVLLFVWWIPNFADFIRMISPQNNSNLSGISYLSEIVPRQIANAHTVYNVALTLILLPFTNIAAKFIERILPDLEEKEEESIFKTKFLEESLISTPTLALNLAKAEIIRMAYKAQKMVENIIIPFTSNNEKILEEIEVQESEINYLNRNITKYLVKIGQESLPDDRADEVFQMMHCVTELEEMGDVISKRLIPLAKKRLEFNINFSNEGKVEIEDYHLRTMKQISRAIEVFKGVNLVDAKRMEKKFKKYRLMEIDLRRSHFDRVRHSVPQSIESSGIHLELIDLLKQISANATNIARIFIESKNHKKSTKNGSSPITENDSLEEENNKNDNF